MHIQDLATLSDIFPTGTTFANACTLHTLNNLRLPRSHPGWRWSRIDRLQYELSSHRCKDDVGRKVYVAGAGPVGLAAAASCHLLGAAVVIVGDYNKERLAQARSFGCETIDISKDGLSGHDA